MLYKTTRSLFKGKYQYKIVLICAGASAFRSGDMESALKILSNTRFPKPDDAWRVTSIKTSEQLDYAIGLATSLKTMNGIEIRVESPWISIYTNSSSHIEVLTSLDKHCVKYISQPAKDSVLTVNTIIMPKTNYDYRITLGKTNQNYQAFVEWANGLDKLKLTKSCKLELSKSRSWGGTHFYVTGENTLLLSKMHLGGAISKIERIVKA